MVIKPWEKEKERKRKKENSFYDNSGARKSSSSDDNDNEGTETLFAAFLILKVSIISRPNLFLCEPSTVVFSKFGLQSWQVRACTTIGWKESGEALVTSEWCSLRRTFKHLPVWPMYWLPQLNGIE